MDKQQGFLSSLRYDLPSSLVVFLVALPLCLGIALASGAPNLFSGIIAGIMGGLVVGSISGSHTSVSGPAAGLTAIVANGISDLGAFEIFLAAVVVAGCIQIVLGIIRAGVIGSFFPVAVIKGMLASIGVILILKQIPHFLGYDADFEGDESFSHGEKNTFTDLWDAVLGTNAGALIIGAVSLLFLIGWSSKLIQRNKILSLVPGPLLAVIIGLLLNLAYTAWIPQFTLSGNHLVEVPVPKSFSELKMQFTFPDFTKMLSMDFLMVAFTIAVIASIESLLSIEAADKLDPFKRNTNNSRELIAQGAGNIASGMIGGLPVTAVIVRSSANISSGARTKTSAIMHGVFLLVAVMLVPRVLNLIPLACLAAILLQVGFKLVKPSLFIKSYKEGWDQFIPFVVTVVAVVLTDHLLYGILIGMAVGIFFVIKNNYRSAITVTEDNRNYLIRFKKDVSFFNKTPLKKVFEKIPDNSYVIIDISKSNFVDHDIRELINDFQENAKFRNIVIETKESK